MFHQTSIASDNQAALARQGDAPALARALQASRRDTLATLAALEAALPGLWVPQRPELNPPLWELGHIGWFQAHWTTRNPQIALGWEADPAAVPAHADDALYDSSAVPHDQRWHLPLPSAETTREQLATQLEQTLQQLLALADGSPRALYFHRLALLHEDMHHEAALYMARALGVPVPDARWRAPLLPEPGPPLPVAGGTVRLGGDMAGGFRFDNECGQQSHDLNNVEIDPQVQRWQDYLPFVLDGGPLPRYLRRQGGAWQQWLGGVWLPLDVREPACHLSAHEAQAWCDWAGRRLPTEVEWVAARQQHPGRFAWGQVWEWTASPFAPYPGFEPHPYRDFSAPWFDGRPVLRGASYLTQPRLRHPDYRNYFTAARNDIPAGFRSCAR
jgi:iron(II)-dependent oxidoreductase